MLLSVARRGFGSGPSFVAVRLDQLHGGVIGTFPAFVIASADSTCFMRGDLQLIGENPSG